MQDVFRWSGLLLVGSLLTGCALGGGIAQLTKSTAHMVGQMSKSNGQDSPPSPAPTDTGASEATANASSTAAPADVDPPPPPATPTNNDVPAPITVESLPPVK